MKISIVQGAFLPVPALRGGAVEKAWFSLGKEFAARGHAVTHISRNFEKLPNTETIDGVRHVRVRGYDAPGSLKFRLILDLFYSRRALSVVPESDIIVTNTFWSPLLQRSIKKGRLYVHVGRYPKGQLKYYAKSAILQTVSAPILDAILAELPGARHRTTVIPYPLAAHFFQGVPTTKRHSILYTGRIHPEKGLEILINAFREARSAFPDWELRIVGPWLHSQGGGGEAYIAKLREQAGTSPVTFTGPLFDETELIKEYRNSSIFCYPSLAEKGETFGLSVLEAMSAGAIPIVSALGCFGDFIKHRTNGLIFNHRVPNASSLLGEQLIELTSKEGLRETLKEACQKTACKYQIEPIAERYLQDFQRFVPTPPNT